MFLEAEAPSIAVQQSIAVQWFDKVREGKVARSTVCWTAKADEGEVTATPVCWTAGARVCESIGNNRRLRSDRRHGVMIRLTLAWKFCRVLHARGLRISYAFSQNRWTLTNENWKQPDNRSRTGVRNGKNTDRIKQWCPNCRVDIDIKQLAVSSVPLQDYSMTHYHTG